MNFRRLAVFLAALAAAAHVGAAGQVEADNPATMGLDYSFIRTDEPIFKPGGYWRVVGLLAVPDSGTLVGLDSTSIFAKFFERVKRWMWDQKSELIVTARVFGERIPKLPATKIVQVKSTGESDATKDVYFYLTPPLLDVSTATIEFVSVRTDKVNSNAVAALASVAAVAVPFLSGTMALTHERRVQLAGKAEDVDTKVGELLSATKTKPVPLGIAPFPFATQKAVRAIRIFRKGGKSDDDLLLTISNEPVETLIMGTNLRADIPAKSVDILAAIVPTADKSTEIEKALFAADQELYKAIYTGSRDSIQTFCGRVEGVLREKLGLADHDRMAVAWAYLAPSPWAGKGEIRPAKDSDDECSKLLAPLAADKSPLPQLKVPRNPRETYVDQAARDKVWATGENLREKLIPVAIQTTEFDKRVEAWRQVLADEVKLGALNRGITLSDKVALQKRSTLILDRDEAATALAKAELRWVKNKAGEKKTCFDPVSWETTRVAFRALTCVQIAIGKEDPLPMITTFYSSLDKSLVTKINFFAD